MKKPMCVMVKNLTVFVNQNWVVHEVQNEVTDESNTYVLNTEHV